MVASVRRAPPASWLQTFETTIWYSFLVWSVAVAIVWILRLDENALRERVADGAVRAAVHWLLRSLEPGWITLAAANVYLALAASEGITIARRWVLLLFLVSLGLAWMSLLTGYPLGHVGYSSVLGMKLGPVPLFIPLLWFAVAGGARASALRLLPRARHEAVVLMIAVLFTATLVNVELVASLERNWWTWLDNSSPHGWLPRVATWFGSGALFGWIMRSPHVAPRDAGARRPAVVLAVLNLVCGSVHLLNVFRG